jgi:POT family proton-dependent oligopeptide transporter
MSAKQPQASRWPPQIKYIVGNEACERFSYYGMKSILAGYITGAVLAGEKGGLGQSADTSTEIIHLFVFANYFMPLFGAWLSDKIIGRYHTILWVSLFYCAGHGVLACSDFAGDVHGKMICLMTGLGLIAFGSGGIKPCVSAFMGDQFRPDQSHLLQKAYGAFYWAINFGSFFSFLVIPWIKDKHGYSLAFAVPGILMALATFIFWLGTKHYVRIPPSRETKNAGFFKVFFTALTGQRTAGQGFWDAARQRFSPAEIDAAKSVPPILFVFALVPVFWSLFDQTNSTWVLQGEKMKTFNFGDTQLVQALQPWWPAITVAAGIFGLLFLPTLLYRKLTATQPASSPEFRWLVGMGSAALCGAVTGVIFKLPEISIGAEQMQSMNPLIVMLLVPLFTLGIYPRIGRLASPLKRMAFGMFLAAGSYLVVAALQTRIEDGAHLSVLWQTLPYVILTAAEVLISTTGLEFAFREAAAELKSTIMSFWLLTVAVGNLLVSMITKIFADGTGENSVSTGRFLMYAGLTFVVAILFSVIATFYKYRDKAAAEGK